MSDPSRTIEIAGSPNGIDRAKLDAVLAPIALAHGAEVVDVEFKMDQGGWVLRIFVEKAGAAAQKLSTEDAAVNLELCSDVARDLSPALDVADLIPHRYSLEVSSPGVERILRGAADFVRFTGKKAKLKLSTPVRGQKVVVGILSGVEGSHVTIKDGGATYSIPLTDISAARLVFEFGPSPKPGKGPKAPKPEKKKPAHGDGSSDDPAPNERAISTKGSIRG